MSELTTTSVPNYFEGDSPCRNYFAETMDFGKIDKLVKAIDIEANKWIESTGTPQQNAFHSQKELEYLLSAVLLEEMSKVLPVEIRQKINHAVTVAASRNHRSAQDEHSKIKEI